MLSIRGERSLSITYLAQYIILLLNFFVGVGRVHPIYVFNFPCSAYICPNQLVSGPYCVQMSGIIMVLNQETDTTGIENAFCCAPYRTFKAEIRLGNKYACKEAVF